MENGTKRTDEKVYRCSFLMKTIKIIGWWGRPEKDGVSSTSADGQQCITEVCPTFNGQSLRIGPPEKKQGQLQIGDCSVDVGLECRF